jgi:hypothetical protein
MPVLYTNNALSNLSASITNSATSLSVTAGTGVRFPNPGGSDYFYATITDTSGEIEIVRVTSRMTDSLTVARGQDGTTARAWGTNANFELRVTRSMLDDFKTDTRAGNAATATALQTARTIGGVSFNGTANINLPGVNTAGNQNTTGSAATLTTGRTIAITGDLTYTSGSFNGSANVTGTGTLANSGVTAGTYGGNNSIPSLTVDAKGRVTAASTVTPSGTYAISISGSSASTTGNAATVTNGVYTVGDQTIGGSKTFSSAIRPPAVASSWIGGHRGNSAVSVTTTGTTSSFHGWASQRTPSGGFALGTLNNDVYLTWATNANIDANTNTVFNALIISSAGTVTAPTFSGALSGNATTATTLQTARTINGTSFNGSANITTANWGTARTLTIGSTGKSVNGSANVSWSLSEIGAQAALGYTPVNKAGDTMTGDLRMPGTLRVDRVPATAAVEGGEFYMERPTGSTSLTSDITVDIHANTLRIMAGTSAGFHVNALNLTYGGNIDKFPSGTKMLFQQTAAPTGWTKDTTHDNKALRVVSGTAGSGGTVAFSTAFASQAVSGSVGNTTLTADQISAHTHGYHVGYRLSGGSGFNGEGITGGPANSTQQNFNAIGPQTTFSAGGGQAHNHSFTGTAINLAVQYVDLIIATKD